MEVSFWHRLTHILARYFSVMPAEVVSASDAVREVTEANLKAGAENAAAGVKLLDELNAMILIIRPEDRQP